MAADENDDMQNFSIKSFLFRPTTAPKATTVATCIETPSCTTIPHFYVNKNLGDLNKMVDCSIPRDERDDPIFAECRQRSASPRVETYVGWMSDAQRAREDEKKRRRMKNMGERCKMAEDLIKGLTEGPGYYQYQYVYFYIVIFYVNIIISN